MRRLDEIEERYSSEGEIEAVQIADDLGILVRAVRQLGEGYLAMDEAFGANSIIGLKKPDYDVMDLVLPND